MILSEISLKGNWKTFPDGMFKEATRERSAV